MWYIDLKNIDIAQLWFLATVLQSFFHTFSKLHLMAHFDSRELQTS